MSPLKECNLSTNKRREVCFLIAIAAFPFLPALWEATVPPIWTACFHTVWTSQLHPTKFGTSKVKIGMSKDDVYRLFGEPREKKPGYWIYNRDYFETVFFFFTEDGLLEDLTI